MLVCYFLSLLFRLLLFLFGVHPVPFLAPTFPSFFTCVSWRNINSLYLHMDIYFLARSTLSPLLFLIHLYSFFFLASFPSSCFLFSFPFALSYCLAPSSRLFSFLGNNLGRSSFGFLRGWFHCLAYPYFLSFSFLYLCRLIPSFSYFVFLLFY